MRNQIVSEPFAKYGTTKARAFISDKPWLRKKRWTEKEYLALETNHLIEFNNGVIEILPMPDFNHQSIAFFIAKAFSAVAEKTKPGFVVLAPFRMKTTNGKYREPDVLFLFNEHAGMFANDYWTGADIAVEIVSPGGEKRDWIDKRADYAATGIAEYWIIEPKAKTITVLKLVGTEYVEHGVFKKSERVTSALLSGFAVDVDHLFASGAPFGK